MTKCKYNCLDNPDAVEKINWKCVECKTDLEQACKDVWAKRKAEAEERAVLAAANAPFTLSDEEIQKRREMY